MAEILSCNACGAPLDVPEGANFVKCNHCQNQLVVRRTETTTSTEVVDRLAKTTESLQGQIEQLNINQELADLDRKWSIDREEFYVTGENGSRHLPTEGMAVAGGVIAVVFGAFWTITAFSMTWGARGFPGGGFGLFGSLFPMFGFVFIGLGIYTSINEHRKAVDFKAANAKYKRRRQELIKKAASSTKSPKTSAK